MTVSWKRMKRRSGSMASSVAARRASQCGSGSAAERQQAIERGPAVCCAIAIHGVASSFERRFSGRRAPSTRAREARTASRGAAAVPPAPAAGPVRGTSVRGSRTLSKIDGSGFPARPDGPAPGQARGRCGRQHRRSGRVRAATPPASFAAARCARRVAAAVERSHFCTCCLSVFSAQARRTTNSTEPRGPFVAEITSPLTTEPSRSVIWSTTVSAAAAGADHSQRP